MYIARYVNFMFLAKIGFIIIALHNSIFPIIPTLFSMLLVLASYYSQNYAGILAPSILVLYSFTL